MARSQRGVALRARFIRSLCARCWNGFIEPFATESATGACDLRFLKQRDSNRTHIVGSMRAGGIGVRQRREIELCDLIQTFAPAFDVQGAPWSDDIATLSNCSGFTAHHVHAIDTRDGKQTMARSIADAKLVFVLRLARDVLPPLEFVGHQYPPLRAIVRPPRGRVGPREPGTGRPERAG